MKIVEIVEWLMVYIMDVIFAPEKLDELRNLEAPTKENFVGAEGLADVSLEGEICILLSHSDPFAPETVREVRNIIRAALDYNSKLPLDRTQKVM